MRIPSHFNQDSLYRRDNRQRETGASNRRLIRLVIGLALVIVVMRQASRPAIYQTFFDPSSLTSTTARQAGDAPSPPREAVGIAGDPESEPSESITRDDSSTPVAVTAEDRKIATALVEDLLPTDQRQWMVSLSQWQTGRTVRMIPSSIESISTLLSALDWISQERRESWQRTLQSFSTATSSSVVGDLDDSPGDQGQTDTSRHQPQPSEEDLPQVSAMLAALDDAANARVVDGSVWRAGDFDSLYRFLDQAEALPSKGVTATGVIPLLQQPDVFRNQWVRINGGVARAERIEAEENPFGINHYWQLWLRPSDGADRPMVAIVSSVPESIAAVGSEATTLEGPEIVVVGRYLKRLAYQSGIGADLAPVVVGKITSAPIGEMELASRNENARTAESLPMWLPILLACLLGVVSAAVVMWRTSVAAKRARRLRMAHRAEPDSFLQDLDHSERHQFPTGEDR